MEMKVLDMGLPLEMTMLETVLKVAKNEHDGGKDTIYAFFAKTDDNEVDVHKSGFKVYSNGIMCEDDREVFYAVMPFTYELVTMDTSCQVVEEIDTTIDPSKYTAKTFVDGEWISIPWHEFISKAKVYYNETGRDIDESFAEINNGELQEFTIAANAVNSRLKSRDELINGAKYKETYERLLPKYKHMLK